jgi:hypothetical protein
LHHASARIEQQENVDGLPNPPECHNRHRPSIVEYPKIVRSQVDYGLTQFTLDRYGDRYLVNGGLERLGTNYGAKNHDHKKRSHSR